MKKIVIKENDANQRIDKYLKKLLCNAPSNFIYKMFRKKDIKINGKKVNEKYILQKDNLKKSYPLIENNFEFIKKLKKDGYKLFLLTNITEDSYNYINSIININDMFDGGIYSYQEHLIKPSYEIYNLVLNRFSLNKEETLFFDDKEKNVIVANELGIKSFIFTSIIDIKNNL